MPPIIRFGGIKIESSEQSSNSHSDQFQYPHSSQSTYPRGRGTGGYRRPFGRGDRNFRGSQGNFGGRNEHQADQNTSGTTSQDHPRGRGPILSLIGDVATQNSNLSCCRSNKRGESSNFLWPKYIVRKNGRRCQ